MLLVSSSLNVLGDACVTSFIALVLRPSCCLQELYEMFELDA